MKRLLTFLALFTVHCLQAATLFVTNYGAIGNCSNITVSTTLGSAVIVTTNTMTSADVGKVMQLFMAGTKAPLDNSTPFLGFFHGTPTNYQDLVVTILSIGDGTHITISTNCGVTTNNILCTYGKDNKTNFDNAIAACANGDTLRITTGNYMLIPPSALDPAYVQSDEFQTLPTITIQKGGINFLGDGTNLSILTGNGAWHTKGIQTAYRGYMFKFPGGVTNDGPLTFANLQFNGNATRNHTSWTGFPAIPTDGTGWDNSHHFYVDFGSAPHQAYIGFTNCFFIRWHGETLYSGVTDGDTRRTIEQSSFVDGNAQAFNLTGTHDCNSNYINDYYSAEETSQGYALSTSYFRNNFITNIYQTVSALLNALVGQINPPILWTNNTVYIGNANGVDLEPARNVTIAQNTFIGGSYAINLGAGGFQGSTNTGNISILNNTFTGVNASIIFGGAFVTDVLVGTNSASGNTTLGSNPGAAATARVSFYGNTSSGNLNSSADTLQYFYDDLSNVFGTKNDIDAHQVDTRGISYGYGRQQFFSTGSAYHCDDSRPTLVPSGARMDLFNFSGAPRTVKLGTNSSGPSIVIPTFGSSADIRSVFWQDDTLTWDTNGVWNGWISQSGTVDGITNSIAWFNAHSVTNQYVYFTGDFTTALEMNWPGTTNDTLQYDMTRARWINDSWPGGAIQCHGYGDVNFIGAQIYATNNGSGRAFTNECIGFDLVNAYGVTMNSCIVTGMYVRIAGSREFSPGTLFGVDTDCVRSTFGVQDLTITNCYLSDAEVLISIKNWSFGFYFSGFNISSNQLYRSCISLSINSAFASLTGAFMENVFIRNNIFDHQTPWSAPPENSSYGLHLNYIFPFFANNGGDYNGYGSVITNFHISGNYFGPDVCGTNFNTSLAIQTQWGVTNITITDWYVDNNVFVWTNTICHSLWNNGFLTLTGNTNLYVVNNDFIVDPAVDCDTGLLSGRNTVNTMESNPVWFVNNFTKNCHLQNYFNGGGTQTNYVPGTWSDYNVFALPWTLYTAGNLGQYDFFGPDPAFPVNGVGYAFPDFTNHLFTVGPVPAHFDVHSTTNNPAINSDYTPQTNSILLNAATNLTAIGITTDYLGHGRPATGMWTIGAFQLAQGTGVTNPVACFTGTPVSGFSPLLVTFTDCSQNANTWSWDFGDSGTSTSQNPTHTYMSPGTYTVTQTVTGFGATNSLTRINYIFVDQHQTVTNVFQGQFQF